MVALGEGAQRRVEDQISRMGTNVLTIRAGQRFFGGVSTGATEDLTVDDAEALRDQNPDVLTISPEISSRGANCLSALEFKQSNSWSMARVFWHVQLEFGAWGLF